MAKKRPEPPRELRTTLEGCPFCTQVHEWLEVVPCKGPNGATHKGTCPATGNPIFIKADRPK